MWSRKCFVWPLNSASRLAIIVQVMVLVAVLDGSGPLVVVVRAALLVTRGQHQYHRHCATSRRGHNNRWRPIIPLSMSTARTIIGATSQLLGEMHRIRMEGEEDGFVSAMGVPTFACIVPLDDGAPLDSQNGAEAAKERAGEEEPLDRRELEHINIQLQQGPAFVLHNLLSSKQCQDIIQACEEAGFADFQAGKNHHGALQVLVSESTADYVAQRLVQHIDLDQVMERQRETEHTHLLGSGNSSSSSSHDDDDDLHSNAGSLCFTGINRRWRVYKYAPDGHQNFAPHIDAGFPPSGLSRDGTRLVWDASSSLEVSRLTILIYLNDDFVGGETNFYQPLAKVDSSSRNNNNLIASVRPQQGSCLVFPQAVGHTAVDYARQHWPLHEGAPVISGESPKYVIRSDVMFRCERKAQQY